MTVAQKQTRAATEPLFLTCPRCGLTIRPRRPWLAIEHCPRCLARSRLPVTLFASPLPPGERQAATGRFRMLRQQGKPPRR